MKFLKKLYGCVTKVFSRRFIIILLIIAEILFLIDSVILMGEVYYIVDIVMGIIAFILSLYIVNRDEDPAYKIAWLFPLLLFPVLTAFLYLFFKLQISLQLIKKGHIKVVEETKDCLQPDENTIEYLESENPKIAGYCRYMQKYAGYPAAANSKADYYPSGEKVFPDIKQALESAENFIFMEFFIITEGKMWSETLDILKRKAQAGVDVRLIYDGFGSQMALPSGYHKKLEAVGVKTRIFSKFTPFLSTSQNNRDHRKIVVVDGKTAFTGGFNMADEYINEKERFGYWKDGGVRITGDAVYNCTVMFLRMWSFLTHEKADCESFKAQSERLDCPEGSFIIPFSDSPIDDEPVGKLTYLNIINNARKYVYISTPYLVLDSDMVTAMEYATKSGVDVKLLLPGIPDKKYMKMIAQSQYKKLLRKGVEIYEFDKGFVHEKLFVSDDDVAVSGSINLDYRSLYLHFECGAFLYRQDCIADMKNDYLEMVTKHATRVTQQWIKEIPLWQKIAGAMLNVISSLL